MAGEADPKTPEGAASGGAAGAGAAGAGGATGGAKADPPPAAKKPDAAAAGGAAGAATANDDESDIIDDDESELPKDKKVVRLTHNAFVKRIARASRSELRKLFGTDDVSEIIKQRAEYTDLKSKDEESKRAAMTEQDRLKADIAKEKERADAAETKHKETVTAHELEQQERVIRGSAKKHIDPTFLKFATGEFAEHIASLTETEAEKIDVAATDKWFKEFVEKHPKMAKEAATETPAADAKPKTGMTNGQKPGAAPKAPASGADKGAKTPRPGLPNSMTPAELREYKVSKGLAP